MKKQEMYSIWLFFILTCLAACGTENIYETMEKEDAAEDAAVELENDNADKAIEILEKALKKDPDDYVLVSLLSAAYAQRGGVSMIDLALNMAESDEEQGDSQNALASLWPLLPEATSDNLADVREGVTQLRSIPVANRTDADNFKLAIISTALASLELKALDANGDGALSLQELSNLKVASADSILASLQGAAGALGSIDTGLGESTDEAANQISTIISEVNNSQGADSAEQLTNYFD